MGWRTRGSKGLEELCAESITGGGLRVECAQSRL